MADEMQVFENEAFGSIRTFEIDWEPWFAAVCGSGDCFRRQLCMAMR